jgi:hypothetical protein
MRNILKVILCLLIIFNVTGEYFFAFAQEDESTVKKVKTSKRKKRDRNDIRYTGFDAKKDPFSPPAKVVQMLETPEKIPGAEIVAKDIKLPKIDLQGIIWSKRSPQVIVNNGVMKVGDYIEDFQIKEIRRSGIILFFKGNDYFIKAQGYKPN